MSDDWRVSINFEPPMEYLSSPQREQIADMLSHVACGILKGEHLGVEQVVLYPHWDDSCGHPQAP